MAASGGRDADEVTGKCVLSHIALASDFWIMKCASAPTGVLAVHTVHTGSINNVNSSQFQEVQYKLTLKWKFLFPRTWPVKCQLSSVILPSVNLKCKLSNLAFQKSSLANKNWHFPTNKTDPTKSQLDLSRYWKASQFFGLIARWRALNGWRSRCDEIWTSFLFVFMIRPKKKKTFMLFCCLRLLFLYPNSTSALVTCPIHHAVILFCVFPSLLGETADRECVFCLCIFMMFYDLCSYQMDFCLCFFSGVLTRFIPSRKSKQSLRIIIVKHKNASFTRARALGP